MLKSEFEKITEFPDWNQIEVEFIKPKIEKKLSFNSRDWIKIDFF